MARNNRRQPGLEPGWPQIGLLMAELHFPAARSLKEKRMVVKALKDRLRDRFGVSVAETGYQELWQRAVVSAVAVSSDAQRLSSVLEAMARDVEDRHGPELVDLRVELLDWGKES